jgi:hypothetical protein
MREAIMSNKSKIVNMPRTNCPKEIGISPPKEFKRMPLIRSIIKNP